LDWAGNWGLKKFKPNGFPNYWGKFLIGNLGAGKGILSKLGSQKLGLGKGREEWLLEGHYWGNFLTFNWGRKKGGL